MRSDRLYETSFFVFEGTDHVLAPLPVFSTIEEASAEAERRAFAHPGKTYYVALVVGAHRTDVAAIKIPITSRSIYFD